MKNGDEKMWKLFQGRLGYNEEEMHVFRANPKSERLLAAAGYLAGTTFTAEVTASHGCFSGHRAGDRIVLDGSGNLVAERSPKKTCLYLLASLAPLVFAAQELAYAGAVPVDLTFNHCACVDVGQSCGGLGRVVLELKADTPEDGPGSV